MADEADVPADKISTLSTSTQIERNDRSEALEHSPRNRMRRMRGRAGIPHTSDVRVPLEPLRKRHGCLLGPLYAERESSRVPNGKKGFERSRCRASQLARLPEGAPECIVFRGGDACQQVRVSADELRCRLQRHCRTEVERLQSRGRNPGTSEARHTSETRVLADEE